MKKLSLLIFLAGFLSFAKATNYADYVNPLVGTQSTFELSTGNTYPAIARPWGMTSGARRQVRWATAGCISTQLRRFADSSRLTSLVRG